MDTFWHSFSREFFQHCDEHCDPLLFASGFSVSLNHKDSDQAYREYAAGQLRFTLCYYSNQFDGTGIRTIASLRPGPKFEVGSKHEVSVFGLAMRLGISANKSSVAEPTHHPNATTLIAACMEWCDLVRTFGLERIQAELLFAGWGSWVDSE